MLHLVQVNAVNAALGRKMSEFRRAHRWSQAELAERVGTALGKTMDPTAITRLEQGRRPLPVHELVVFSQVLEVEPVVFLKFLTPLDNAVAATESLVRRLRNQAALAEETARLAERLLDGLQRLQEFRGSQTMKHLIDGLSQLIVVSGFPELWRADWRETLIDAGVSPHSIEAALKVAPGFPGDPADLDVKLAFYTTLLVDHADPPTRRRKTGRVLAPNTATELADQIRETLLAARNRREGRP